MVMAFALLAAFGDVSAALEIPSPLPALAARTHSRFRPAPGVIAERISYATQMGLRIPAILYLPEKRPEERLPGLIVVNGHGGDKYSWYAFYSGIAYARAGAAVLTYDPIGEGERNSERRSGTRAHDAVIEAAAIEPERLGRRMGGLMVTDVMQAVSFLEARPEVDPRRIGAMGYSMGSFVLSLACAADPRVRACVLAGGGNLDGAGGYWDRSKPMCQGMPYRAMAVLGEDRAAAIYALHARRGATLIINGTEDTVVNMPATGVRFFDDLRIRTIQASGVRQVFTTMFVPGASHRPYFVTPAAGEWLADQLGLKAWDAVRFQSTHIGSWARERGVEMDERYASEDREGGTRAIGSRVPALAREQLHVFTASEWETAKRDTIYEEWVRRVK